MVIFFFCYRGRSVGWCSSDFERGLHFLARSKLNNSRYRTPRTDDLYDLYDLYDLFPLQFMI